MARSGKKGNLQVSNAGESGRLSNLSVISPSSSVLSKKELRKLKPKRSPVVTRNGGIAKNDKNGSDPTVEQINSLVSDDSGGVDNKSNGSLDSVNTTTAGDASPPTNSNSSNNSSAKEVQLEQYNLGLKLEVEELKRKLEFAEQNNRKIKKPKGDKIKSGDKKSIKKSKTKKDKKLTKKALLEQELENAQKEVYNILSETGELDEEDGMLKK
jgi:hypothetical protein